MSGPTTIEHPQLGQAGPVTIYRDREILGNYDTLTDWNLQVNTDGANLVLSDDNIRGLKSISFDKIDSANNTIFASIENVNLNLDLSRFYHDSVIRVVIKIPDVTNVTTVVVELGNDATNRVQFSITAGFTSDVWLTLEKKLTDSGAFGTGWNLSSIKYIKIFVQFAAEANTLAGILVDEVSIITL